MLEPHKRGAGDQSVPRLISKPWGHELIWAHTEHYAGKVLHIKKGESLSYQYHRVKDETIYLLSGSLELEVGAEDELASHVLSAGDCFHIPPGLPHRMCALEESDVLEASTPQLDDVVRLKDRYGRV